MAEPCPCPSLLQPAIEELSQAAESCCQTGPHGSRFRPGRGTRKEFRQSCWRKESALFCPLSPQSGNGVIAAASWSCRYFRSMFLCASRRRCTRESRCYGPTESQILWVPAGIGAPIPDQEIERIQRVVAQGISVSPHVFLNVGQARTHPRRRSRRAAGNSHCGEWRSDPGVIREAHPKIPGDPYRGLCGRAGLRCAFFLSDDPKSSRRNPEF